MKQKVKSKKGEKVKMMKKQPIADSRQPLAKLLTANRLPITAKKGFTMIELLVVIVVMGILLAFSLPAIHTTKLRFGQAVDGVYSKLKFAKQEAMTKGVNYGFNWNSTAFWIFADSLGGVANDTFDAGEPSDTIKLSSGINIANSSTGAIDFNLDGTATNSDSLILTSPSEKDTVKIYFTVAGFIYKTP